MGANGQANGLHLQWASWLVETLGETRGVLVATHMGSGDYISGGIAGLAMP